jgi:hypothetical protein
VVIRVEAIDGLRITRLLVTLPEGANHAAPTPEPAAASPTVRTERRNVAT